jgi:hypothetical protein
MKNSKGHILISPVRNVNWNSAVIFTLAIHISELTSILTKRLHVNDNETGLVDITVQMYRVQAMCLPY